MHQRTLSLSFDLALCAALAFCLTLFGRTAHAAPSASDRMLTIRLISSVSSGGIVTDLPPKGVLNEGDAYAVTDALRNAVAQFERAKGAVVGRDSVAGAVLSGTSSRIRVRVTLPGGTLRAQGTLKGSTGPYIINVVGGTGRYRNARGTAVESVLNKSQTRALDVYRLRLP